MLRRGSYWPYGVWSSLLGGARSQGMRQVRCQKTKQAAPIYIITNTCPNRNRHSHRRPRLAWTETSNQNYRNTEPGERAADTTTRNPLRSTKKDGRSMLRKEQRASLSCSLRAVTPGHVIRLDSRYRSFGSNRSHSLHRAVTSDDEQRNLDAAALPILAWVTLAACPSQEAQPLRLQLPQ